MLNKTVKKNNIAARKLFGNCLKTNHTNSCKYKKKSPLDYLVLFNIGYKKIGMKLLDDLFLSFVKMHFYLQ